jgi:hypothetical protein
MKATEIIISILICTGVYSCSEPKEADAIELVYENAWGEEPIVDTFITGEVKNYLKPNYLWFGFLPNMTKKNIELYLRKDKAILFDTLNISGSYAGAVHVIVKIDTSIASLEQIISKYIESNNMYHISYVYTNKDIKEPCDNVDYISCSNIFRLNKINASKEVLDSLLNVTNARLWASTDSTITIEIDGNSVGGALYVRNKFIKTGRFNSDKIYTRSWYSLSDYAYSDISVGDYCLYFH